MIDWSLQDRPKPSRPCLIDPARLRLLLPVRLLQRRGAVGVIRKQAAARGSVGLRLLFKNASGMPQLPSRFSAAMVSLMQKYRRTLTDSVKKIPYLSVNSLLKF